MSTNTKNKEFNVRWIALVFMILVSMVQVGCTTLADAKSARGTGTARIYDVTPDAVWTALPKAVKEAGLDYVGDNRNDGYALAQRGLSAFSYGENVAMFIEPSGSKDRTKVEVVSKRALATNVFATNWETVILDKLTAMFPSSTSEETQVSGRGITSPSSPDASSPPKQHSNPVPAASSFADINDVNAIPFIGAEARAKYKVYLSAPAPKAFVISQLGGWRWLSNDSMAMRKTLAICLAKPGAQCWLYAVDDKVVWQSEESKRVSLEQLVLQKAESQ